MQFTEPDSWCWQGSLCQSQMNQIPFQSVLAPQLFWCYHGQNKSRYWEALLGREWVSAETGTACHLNNILTEWSKRREDEICWCVRSELLLRAREGVPHPGWESASYRFCLSLSLDGGGIDAVTAHSQTSWENISRKKSVTELAFWFRSSKFLDHIQQLIQWNGCAVFGMADKNRGEGMALYL